MSDGSIRIDTSIDQSGIDKGVKGVSQKIAGFSKKTLAPLTEIASGVSLVGTSFTLVSKGVKAAAAVVTDLTNTYKTQQKAEVQLQTAAKNNPYLNETAVNSLKNYASQLQGISTFGDEELIPFMAQLASAGRTESEIMDIMAVSVDIAASGTMSLESAVRNLNKTYGGYAGELGEAIPQVKQLTTEQLKQGAAVKVLGAQYAGMAKDVALATGTSEQLKNAIGDLKEEFGAPFEKSMGPVRAFFTEVIAGWANAKKAKREYEEAKEAKAEEKQTVSQDELLLERQKKNFENTDKELTELDQKWRQLKVRIDEGRMDSVSKSNANKLLGEYAEKIAVLAGKWQEEKKAIEETTAAINERKAAEAAAATKAQSEADAKAKAAAEKKRNDDAAAHIKNVTAAREKAVEILELQAKAQGKEVDAQDVLNAYMASYVSLVAESGGLITQENSAAVALLATIQQMTAAVLAKTDAEKQAAQQKTDAEKDAVKAEKDAQKAAEERAEREKETVQKITDILAEGLSDRELIAQQMTNLEIEYEQLSADQRLAIEEDYMNAWWILKKKQQKLDEEDAALKKTKNIETAQSIISTVNDFASQYASIMSSITELATKQAESEATIKTAAIQKQYADGLISQEEYEKQKAEIDKEAAQKKYELDMWTWTASLLTATANTAMGVVTALGQPGNSIVNMVLAGLIGAAGAAQLAVITANKPIPPSFATGGIVGGSSYHGDKVRANLNSREMILNAGQQNNLFDAINNGNIGSGFSGDIKIYNSAANDVQAKPVITEDGIRIMIQKTVNKDMADGRFNKSMRKAQGSFYGSRYTN